MTIHIVTADQRALLRYLDCGDADIYEMPPARIARQLEGLGMARILQSRARTNIAGRHPYFRVTLTDTGRAFLRGQVRDDGRLSNG